MTNLQNLKSKIASKKLDGAIITNATNIFYLTGFKGVSPLEREAILIVTDKKSTLITARLYQAEANKLKSKDLDVIIVDERGQILESIKDALISATRIGFEEHDLKFSEFNQFKKALSGKKLVPIHHLVEDLRVIKNEDEIKNIERAQIISQKAFEKVIKTLKAGQTENQIAETLEKIIKELGGQGLAFETIVAGGQNSAIPHHVTANRRLATGDILLVDFGAKFQHYSADLTRTIYVGKSTDKFRNIYNHVAQAQQKSIAKITKDLKASKAYQSANAYFKKHGLNENFLHSLGHGIGLEVHEKPSLGKKSNDTLVEGMVFSVEPGLYFENWGGVRIEDLVTIRKGRAQILGKSAEFVEIL